MAKKSKSTDLQTDLFSKPKTKESIKKISDVIDIYSWNVNGIRSVASKGLLEWIEKESPDILCLQETKARSEQLTEELLSPFNYLSHWHSAEKPGYSGVAIYSKTTPLDIQAGIGFKDADREGRVITAHFENFSVVNAYFPNSQREHTRLPFKLEFCKAIFEYCEKLRRKGRKVILCGDYNIAHKEIDLKNAKANEKNAGYLPEERAWMDFFTANGWVDSLRHFSKEPGQYTWWSYRPGIRERNIGWRLDYHCVNQEFTSQIEKAQIHHQVFGSDHCPVSITVKDKK